MFASGKVLICDEADSFRHQLQEMLQEAGVEVTTCASWREVAGVAERARPDIVVVDVLTPTFDVEELVRVRNVAPEALLAVVSSVSREPDHSVAEGTGGIDLVLSKRDPPGLIVAALLDRL
jgi:two-component system OmpR family response regulator